MTYLLLYLHLWGWVSLACTGGSGGYSKEVSENIYREEAKGRKGRIKKRKGRQDFIPIRGVCIEEILQIKLHSLQQKDNQCYKHTVSNNSYQN